MRYLIGISLEKEVEERKKYIYDVFKLYLINKGTVGNLLVYESFPANALDMLIIIGHSFDVKNYLRVNADEIKETILVVISCYAEEFINDIEIKNKKVYISHHEDGETFYRKGQDYGFKFKITDSELDLYNSRKMELSAKLAKSFVKIL